MHTAVTPSHWLVSEGILCSWGLGRQGGRALLAPSLRVAPILFVATVMEQGSRESTLVCRRYGMILNIHQAKPLRNREQPSTREGPDVCWGGLEPVLGVPCAWGGSVGSPRRGVLWACSRLYLCASPAPAACWALGTSRRPFLQQITYHLVTRGR